MSTASFVPPTRDLEADEAGATLGRQSVWQLLVHAFLRFRHADGFSHARSLGFQIVFALIPGVILAVATAVRLGQGRVQSMLRETITTMTPGPAGDIFLRAFEQASGELGQGNLLAIAGGATTAILAGTAGMAQLQRGATRIYGILSDRPPTRHYGLAALLALTVGVIFAAAFLLIVFGATALGGLQGEIARNWGWLRWPVGVALLVAGLAALFKVAPNREQPDFSWLAFGGLLASIGWLAVSVGLSIYLNASSTFGQTYGPLAGFLGVMLWAELSAIVIFYGLAVAAQLEAVRAGVESPVIEAQRAIPVEWSWEGENDEEQ